MINPVVTLRHFKGNSFENVQGGNEPIFAKFKDGGQIIYMHQSGYGCLRAEEVRILAGTGSDESKKGEA